MHSTQLNEVIEILNKEFINEYLEYEKKLFKYNLSDRINFRAKSPFYNYLTELICLTFSICKIKDISHGKLSQLTTVLNSMLRFSDESGVVVNSQLADAIIDFKQHLKNV